MNHINVDCIKPQKGFYMKQVAMPSKEDILDVIQDLEQSMVNMNYELRSEEDNSFLDVRVDMLEWALSSNKFSNDTALKKTISEVLKAISSINSWDNLFFSRPYTSDYSSDITNENIKNRKALRLFNECFSNFNTPNVYHKRVMSYVDDKDRWIDYDALQAEFYSNDEYYIPPRFTPSIGGDEICYMDFVERVTSNADNGDGSTGSNRLSFLNGPIGSGKTAIACKIMYDKMRANTAEYNFIFRFDIETEWKKNSGQAPKPINEKFFKAFANLFCVESEYYCRNFELDVSNRSYCSSDNPYNYIIHRILDLKSKNINVTIIMDNLDRYSFYYDRYTFFKRGQKNHDKSVGQISRLYDVFNKSELKNLGICILFVVRDYVLDKLIMSNSLDPDYERNTYNISYLKNTDVLHSRMNLFTNSINLIPVDEQRKYNIPFYYILDLLGLSGTIKDNTTESALSTVHALCHHGHRSMIDFVSKLKIDVLDSQSLHRFLNNRSLPLVFMYILNYKKRYTQSSNHFPNLFLIDCLVYKDKDIALDYPEAHEPHVHTYWLKILLLTYIEKNSMGGNYIQVRDIINVFCKDGIYETHLVKLCLGSLSSFNEMACIKIVYGNPSLGILASTLKLTSRGKKLISVKRGVPFYMKFPYLQMAIDDHLLWFPKINSHDFTHEYNYNYLNKSDNAYFEEGSKLIIERSKSALYFIHILKRFLQLEINNSPRLFCENRFDLKWLPDFELAEKDILNFLRSTKKHMPIDTFVDYSLSDFLFSINHSADLDCFFEKAKKTFPVKVDY